VATNHPKSETRLWGVDFGRIKQAMIMSHPKKTIDPLLELVFDTVGETAAVDQSTRPPFSAVVARLRFARLRLPRGVTVTVITTTATAAVVDTATLPPPVPVPVPMAVSVPVPP
jgi:hypothetical protein